MSFDWQEYIRLAKQLCASPADEASLRTAISRAYYAAYHVAKEYVETNIAPMPARGGDTHWYVWTTLATGTASKPRAANRGNGLKRQRVSADYEPEFKGSLEKLAIKAVQDAEAIILEVT